MSATPIQSREGFIWQKAGIREGLKTKAVAPGTSHVKSSYDVIVIGTGFAGLTAARELSRDNNLNILLLEARDRLGGRTWTANELGEELEMGGTWVHWNQPHVYSELCRYGLQKNLKPTIAALSPERTTHNFGTVLEDLNGESFFDVVERVASLFFSIDGLTSRDLMPYPHDPLRRPSPWVKYDSLSVSDRLSQLDIPVQEKALFECYVGLFGCNPPEDIGFIEALRWYALAGHTMNGVYELSSLYKLGNGGMSSFAIKIFHDIRGDVLFNTEVKSIHQDGSNTHVITKDGQKFTSSAVISTIPLNCLADIEFVPPLSGLRKEAADFGQQNMGAKVHFKVKGTEPLWFGTSSVKLTTPYMLGFADHHGTSSTGSTFSLAAVKTGSLGDPADHAFVIQEYRKAFSERADVEAYLLHDWSNDPFAKGQWSCWAAGGMSKYLEELQSPHHRILFASADWADGWRGFIDGAIESGKRAALEIQPLLRINARETRL